MKVIGYKVSNSFYYKIKKEHGNVSEFLRKAVDYYLNSKVNGVNSTCSNMKDVYEYDLLCKALDSLPKRNNQFSNEKEFE